MLTMQNLQNMQNVGHYKTLYWEFTWGVFEGEYSSIRAQNAHNTQVQGELKVGKLYFHNNSSILGFLKNG